ncbi:MAG: serine hydrolase, partial [Caldilineaceae bacterium]|nr:serine hydrolase [Caldilineaceae bacterium]
YLQPRLFAPLGIANATWSVGPRGINIGFTGLRLTTAAIARFGQLYLQKGMWQGEQLLPAAWVEEATKRQVSNGTNPEIDDEQGYGYQFWRARHGAYSGNGAFGQFCEMWPEHDVVLAITGGKEGMEVIQDLIWEHLLPATRPSALPEDHGVQQALHSKLSRLAIPLPQGQPRSPLAAKVSQHTYGFRAHEQNPTDLRFDFGHGPFFVTFATITFDFTASSTQEDGCICTIVDNRGCHEVVCGHGHWHKGTTTVNSTDGHTLQPVAASGAWTADNTYEMQWCFVETAFRTTLVCHFEEDRITLNWHENARFGDVKSLQLQGREVKLS